MQSGINTAIINDQTKTNEENRKPIDFFLSMAKQKKYDVLISEFSLCIFHLGFHQKLWDGIHLSKKDRVKYADKYQEGQKHFTYIQKQLAYQDLEGETEGANAILLAFYHGNGKFINYILDHNFYFTKEIMRAYFKKPIYHYSLLNDRIEKANLLFFLAYYEKWSAIKELLKYSREDRRMITIDQFDACTYSIFGLKTTLFDYMEKYPEINWYGNNLLLISIKEYFYECLKEAIKNRYFINLTSPDMRPEKNECCIQYENGELQYTVINPAGKIITAGITQDELDHKIHKPFETIYYLKNKIEPLFPAILRIASQRGHIFKTCNVPYLIELLDRLAEHLSWQSIQASFHKIIDNTRQQENADYYLAKAIQYVIKCKDSNIKAKQSFIIANIAEEVSQALQTNHPEHIQKIETMLQQEVAIKTFLQTNPDGSIFSMFSPAPTRLETLMNNIKKLSGKNVALEEIKEITPSPS